MIILKEYVGMDVWLEPAGNNLRYLKDDKLNGSYHRVVKVARLNISVAEIFPDGSLRREFNIKRSDWNESYYTSSLNAGYYTHLSKDAYEHSQFKKSSVAKIVKAIKNNHSLLNNLTISQLESIASVINVNLGE